MINKVLIAEDHELANLSLQQALEALDVKDFDYAYYCDDALIKIKNSRLSGNPYDLIITDLNFETDMKKQQVNDGISLIEAARKELPELKVIVFSVESKPAVIESLFLLQHIDGYVRKSRNDGKELKLAIESLNRNQQYYPRHLLQSVNQKNSYEFTDFDIEIIALLASGVSQKNIPTYLQQKNIRPSSLSAVEKGLSQMKTALEFSKNEQLVAFCKDMGII